MESKKDWILRGYYRMQQNRDGEGKGEWSVELARTQKYERHQEIFRPCKLLQEVYQGFCLSSKANKYANYAMGGVLSMKCSDELWRPVAFISKSLSDTERNYKIHDKEMLAVVRCLEAWRHFLERTVVKFKIWTDHKNLEYFMKVQKLNR